MEMKVSQADISDQRTWLIRRLNQLYLPRLLLPTAANYYIFMFTNTRILFILTVVCPFAILLSRRREQTSEDC